VFATLIAKLSSVELQAMKDGCSQFAVSDMDFLETLAAHKCFLAPPWVLRANPSGQLARVTRIAYDEDGNLDKAGVLLAVAGEFRRTVNRQRHVSNRLTF